VKSLKTLKLRRVVFESKRRQKGPHQGKIVLGEFYIMYALTTTKNVQSD